MNYLNELYQNGYLIVKGLIPKEDVNLLLQSFQKTFNDQLNLIDELNSVKSNDLKLIFLSLYNKDEEIYKKVLSSLWRKLDCYDLAHHANIINFIKTQFGWQDIFIPGGQVVHVMSDKLKIQNGYFGLAPHQDFPSVQGSTLVPMLEQFIEISMQKISLVLSKLTICLRGIFKGNK